MADRTEELRTHAVTQQVREDRWNNSNDQIVDLIDEIAALKEQLRIAEASRATWYQAWQHADSRAQDAETHVMARDTEIAVARLAVREAEQRAEQAEALLAMARYFEPALNIIIARTVTGGWQVTTDYDSVYRRKYLSPNGEWVRKETQSAVFNSCEAAFAAWEEKRAQEGSR